jgi:hypothetical protein
VTLPVGSHAWRAWRAGARRAWRIHGPWTSLGLLLLWIGVDAGTAQAAPHAPTIEVTVILATRSDAGASIDPLLRDLPQLSRDEPFVRYNVYKVLDRRELPLEADKPAATPLPNGRLLQMTLVDPPASAAGAAPPHGFHVRAEIGEPGKKAFLKLLEVTASGNEPFFVGGQSFAGGTLFLELVVRP